MESPADDTAEMYRSSWLHMLASFLRCTVLLTLLASIPLPCFDGSLTGFLVPANIALFSFFRVLLFGNVTVGAGGGEVFFRRPFRRTMRFPLDQFVFSTEVIKNEYNGIPFWTNRILIASGGAGTQRLHLTNFSAVTFSRLFGCLRRLTVKPDAALLPEAGCESAAVHFSLPRAALVREHRISVLTAAGIFFLFVAVFFVACVYIDDQLFQRPKAFTAFMWTLGIIAGILGILRLHYWLRARAMPETAAVDGSSLVLDDTRYVFLHLQQILATPPDYASTGISSCRWLRITGQDGRRSWNFGRCLEHGHWKAVFTEYEELLAVLEAASEKYGFDFRYDL